MYPLLFVTVKLQREPDWNLGRSATLIDQL